MDKKKVVEIFEEFNNKKVMIIGDIMIDSYLLGNVERISPEAPVPVLSVSKKENRLGGAANVALNIKALGAIPIICTVVGKDESGKVFEDLLIKRAMPKEGVLFSKSRKTTTKTRVISQGQHIIRVDDEIGSELNYEDESAFIENVTRIIHNNNIDVIIFEDYDKGVITDNVISKIIIEAKKQNIITTVDPKKRNFLKYKNVTLFKPNLKELSEGLKIDINKNHKEEIYKAVEVLKNKLECDIVFSTLSELGCYIKSKNENYYLPAEIRKIADVSGAGDTVISVASLCLSVGVNLETIAYISNIAGGIVCESVGVVSINKEELIKEIVS